MQAVFIIGEQRSGSNLLRVMLNEHSTITAPHPPHILSRFQSLLPYYGDLSDENRFQLLLDHVCQLVERNPISWHIPHLDRQLIRSKCRSNSLVAILGALMEVDAIHQQANIWVCKSMQNVYFAPTLQDYFDHPYFIYLYRDPRDVVLSFKKAYIGDKHPYFIAKRWVERQEACLALQKQVAKSHFFALSYESFMAQPKDLLNDLCHFLGIQFEEKMLQYYLSKEASNAANAGKQWHNIQKPLLVQNTNKYLREMPVADRMLVEQICQATMSKLGYVIDYPATIPHFSAAILQQFTTQNNLLKTQIQSKFNKNYIQTRNHQLALLEAIKNQLIPA